MKLDHIETAAPASAFFLRSAYAAVCLPLASAAVATLIWSLQPVAVVAKTVTESGLLENASVVLYGAAMLAVLFATRSGSGWKTSAALLIGIAGLAARELDLHRTAANDSVLTVSFYFGSAPVQVKLLAFAAVALFLGAIGRLVLRHAGELLRELKQTDPLAITVFVFFMTGIVAKTFDRSVGMLIEDFEVALSTSAAVWAQAIEESLEACLPLLIMLGAYQVRALKPTAGAVVELYPVRP